MSIINNPADTLNANLTFDGADTFATIGSANFLGGFTVNNTTAIGITSTQNITITTTNNTLTISSHVCNISCTTDINIGVPAANITFDQSSATSTITCGTLNLNASTLLNTTVGSVNMISTGLIYISAISGNNIALAGFQIQVEGSIFNIDTSTISIVQTLPSASSPSATAAFVPSVSTQKFLVWDSADNNVKLYAG